MKLTRYEDLPQSFPKAYDELVATENPPKWVKDIKKQETQKKTNLKSWC